jgi:hypothetical protein
VRKTNWHGFTTIEFSQVRLKFKPNSSISTELNFTVDTIAVMGEIHFKELTAPSATYQAIAMNN